MDGIAKSYRSQMYQRPVKYFTLTALSAARRHLRARAHARTRTYTHTRPQRPFLVGNVIAIMLCRCLRGRAISRLVGIQ